MGHKMRRFKQLLPQAETEYILNVCTGAVISLIDQDGMPYGVPVSYVYDGNGHIYLHSANTGHKIDCIHANPRCSFCVIAQDKIVPEEFTTYFRSVIVSGTIRIITDDSEILNALHLLCDKYCAGIDPDNEIKKCWKNVCVLRIDVEDITGKESIELVGQRNI